MIEKNIPSEHQDKDLGAARAGTMHWFMMQVTTAAIIPLSLYVLGSFLVHVVATDAQDKAAVALQWLHRPTVGVPLIVLIPLMVFNSFDYVIEGLFEDYVHQPVLNFLGIWGAKFFGVALSVTGIAAILKIMLGA